MKPEELENLFSYHPPKNSQVVEYQTLRAAALDFALEVNKLCPDSREKSLAITAIQQAVMWANAAKALHEEK